MQNANIQLETLTCPSCLQKIDNAVKSLDGVDKDTVKVRFNASRVSLDFDETKVSIKEIENSISKLGYEVLKTRVK